VTPTTVHFGGEQLLLDPSGAAFWPAAGVLAVADMHFEKSTAAAAQGSLLPPYDSQATLAKLQRVATLYRPATLVCLGDSFHDAAGQGRLRPADRAALLALAAQVHFIWITGNHDPILDGLPGDVMTQWRRENLHFCHQAGQQADGAEISGHFHPKASLVARGRRISRPCFAMDDKKLILPSFGAYTGGLDVRSPAIARLFPHGSRVFLLGRENLFVFSLTGPPS
jgi:uncharacterized protein